MTTRAVEQFDEWESSPFRDGYRGLHDLADEEFSGVVQAGAAKLCMLNGTVVGIMAAALVILTYYAGKAISTAEKKMEADQGRGE